MGPALDVGSGRHLLPVKSLMATGSSHSLNYWRWCSLGFAAGCQVLLGVVWIEAAGSDGPVTAWLRLLERRSIWSSLSCAPARLMLSPSTSPDPSSRWASAMLAMRLARI